MLLTTGRLLRGTQSQPLIVKSTDELVLVYEVVDEEIDLKKEGKTMLLHDRCCR